MKIGAIGVIEVNFCSNAVIVLDAMLKASDVKVESCYKTLGGRMVHIIISGSTSQVDEAVNAAKQAEDSQLEQGSLKVAVTISNPHSEILRFINN